MCGIAGFMDKRATDTPVGQTMLAMLEGVSRRGPDSAGVALYRSDPVAGEICWIRLPADPAERLALEPQLIGRIETAARVQTVARLGDMVRVELVRDADVDGLRAAIERPTEDVEVVSLGRQLELIKDVGAPAELDRRYGLSSMRGGHAIGHTRLSTESRIDLSHSQPFWARGVADLATVHNGHITNYHRLRRIYEQQGVRFFTENDSEVIGVYLADQMARGLSLEDALAASLEDLDGSFTYLVATATEMGFARDRFALKPLVVVETDDYIALANEEIAIRTALGPAGVAREPSGHVFRLWRTPAAMPAGIAA
jgi:glutamate synthase domain-containing protein 1